MGVGKGGRKEEKERKGIGGRKETRMKDEKEEIFWLTKLSQHGGFNIPK